MKTLSLRLDRQQSNANAIAELLEAHPAVDRVYFPGFADARTAGIHRSQASGDGAVLSFVTGDPELSRAVVEATKLFAITVSFGGVNSTISLPNYMSHASIPASLRQQKSIPADLVRISVGAEDVDDLLDDLGQAFEVGSRQPIRPRPWPRIRPRKGSPFRLPGWLLLDYSCGGVAVEAALRSHAVAASRRSGCRAVGDPCRGRRRSTRSIGCSCGRHWAPRWMSLVLNSGR